MRDGKVLLGQRRKYPVAKAPCAGHVEEWPGIPTGAAAEENVFRQAGVRELEEEFSLKVRPRDLRLAFPPVVMHNRCRRDTVDGGGPWHMWWVFTVDIPAHASPRGNRTEMTDLAWYSIPDALRLPDLEDVWRVFLNQIQQTRR